MKKKFSLAIDQMTASDREALSKWIKNADWLTMGPKVLEFEKMLCSIYGCKYAIMVNSGSSANLAIATAYKERFKKKQPRVVVPAVSWATTLSPFMQLGYTPILCDAEPFGLGMDPAAFEKICQEESPDAAMLVHVLGHPALSHALAEICQKYGVVLLEDCCEANGTRLEDGTLVGGIGAASSISTYFSHQISTIEGGAVLTSDHELAQIIKSIRAHGWARDLAPDTKKDLEDRFNVSSSYNQYTFYYQGYNLRPTEITAFIGLRSFPDLEKIVSHRQKLFETFSKKLPQQFWRPQTKYQALSSFGLSTLVTNRDELSKKLLEQGIESRPIICGNIGRQPFWVKEYGETRMPIADAVHDHGIYLPNTLDMTTSDIEFIVKIVEKQSIPYKLNVAPTTKTSAA